MIKEGDELIVGDFRNLPIKVSSFTDEMIKYIGKKGRVLFISSCGTYLKLYFDNGHSYYYDYEYIKAYNRFNPVSSNVKIDETLEKYKGKPLDGFKIINNCVIIENKIAQWLL